jgi:type IV pilus assembly protein PilA
MEYRRSAASRGITLIELMIVVAIIGVLAVLAAVGYGRWISASKMAEATNMVAAIRNGQENYYSQTARYLDVSKTLNNGDLFPAKNPNNGKTPWAGDCGWCNVVGGFQKLGVKSDKPVYFGYATVAGDETKDPAARGAQFMSKGTGVDWSAENGGAAFTKPWFIAAALADTNGNGKYAGVCATSFGKRVIVDNEGE